MFLQKKTAAPSETPTPPGTLLSLIDVKKAYKTEAGDFYALKGINVEINKGEFVGVVGKSGSGKSTLINMITGIDRPSSGEIWVNDQAIHGLDENKMARWRGRSMGVVFQFFQLLPTLTVVENVMLPMDFCRLYTPKERKARAMVLLEHVDMAEQNLYRCLFGRDALLIADLLSKRRPEFRLCTGKECRLQLIAQRLRTMEKWVGEYWSCIGPRHGKFGNTYCERRARKQIKNQDTKYSFHVRPHCSSDVLRIPTVVRR